MRGKIALVLLALCVAGSATSVCASPPPKSEVTLQTATVKDGASHIFTAPAPEVYVLSAKEYSLDGAIVLEQPNVVVNAAAVPAEEQLTENCSKPQRTGLAIRLRVSEKALFIHVIIASTSGHRLLHIDPGLC